MHISTGQSSPGQLEPRGCSCDPPAVFSQPPGAQAACAVKGCRNPGPLENVGEMGCKWVVCMEQVPCFAGKICGCPLFALSWAGSAGHREQQGPGIPWKRESHRGWVLGSTPGVSRALLYPVHTELKLQSLWVLESSLFCPGKNNGLPYAPGV